MFSADLSWTEPDTEKVGERKERLAREKERDGPNSSGTPSVKSSKSSKSSILDDRELWWTTGLKKAKNIKPTRRPRAETNRSTGSARRPSIPVPHLLDIDSSRELKDPILQPAWTYSSTLSPTLPSGAPLDPPEYEVPELEGDLSSRYTNLSGSRSSDERRWGWKSPGKVKVIDEVHEVQQLSPRSFIARTTRVSSESVDAQEEPNPRTSPQAKKKKTPYTVKIEGCMDLETLRLEEGRDENAALAEHSIVNNRSNYANRLPDASTVAWRPPSEWNIVLPEDTEQGQQLEKQLPPIPNDDVAVAHSSTVELTRFQRFIRRMESAGPKIILDRLKEEWHQPVDEEADEELTLEKQLWVLTAFQLQNLGKSRIAPKPTANTGKILELYGNLSEVYQLSAMNPRQTVNYLTDRPQRPIPLPGNVSYSTVPQAGSLPLPFQDGLFSHIRASTLPSVVPSSKLPRIFQECHRLLAPGGMLEIRIMDAAPIRETAGPKMRAWIEDRLSLNLERLFRCSKPCMLVPGWVTDAGFTLSASRLPSHEQNMKLPCTVDPESSDVDKELSMLIGRALWRNIWGGFVDDMPGEPHWWWEDEEVMEECKQRQTVFECGALFAFRE